MIRAQHRAPSEPAPADLLGRGARVWRADIDRRHGPAIDDVLDGRRRAIVYPAARLGRAAAMSLKSVGVDVVAFGDRSLHGTVVDDLPVLSPDEIAVEHPDAVVLVASALFDSPIRETLQALGCRSVVPIAYLVQRLPEAFPCRELLGSWSAATDPINRLSITKAHGLFVDAESRRVFLGKLAFYLGMDKGELDAIRTTEPIYFDPTVYELTDHEVVVDAGAYVGDTLESFLACSGGRFAAYHAFEPDPSNLPELERAAAVDPSRISVVAAGIGREKSVGRLLANGGGDSRILADDEPGGTGILTLSLDDYFDEQGSTPSIVKMDIEGAEAAALAGASRVIRDAAPVLAISAYHYPTDLWTIPLLMSRLAPEAALYLRHYTREVDDTVCYAVPPARARG